MQMTPRSLPGPQPIESLSVLKGKHPQLVLGCFQIVWHPPLGPCLRGFVVCLALGHPGILSSCGSFHLRLCHAAVTRYGQGVFFPSKEFLSPEAWTLPTSLLFHPLKSLLKYTLWCTFSCTVKISSLNNEYYCTILIFLFSFLVNICLVWPQEKYSTFYVVDLILSNFRTNPLIPFKWNIKCYFFQELSKYYYFILIYKLLFWKELHLLCIDTINECLFFSDEIFVLNLQILIKLISLINKHNIINVIKMHILIAWRKLHTHVPRI